MNELDGFTSEELDEENQSLIRDLRRMYPGREQVAQSLDNVRDRLPSKISSVRNVPVSAQQHLLTHQNGAERRKQNARRKTRLRSAVTRFSAVAAAIFVLLLVGSLVLLFTLERQSGVGGDRSRSNKQAQIIGIHMINESIGWGLCSGAVLLRTIDGGIHWQDVSPNNLPDTTYWGGETSFLGTSTAWLTVTPNENSSQNFQPEALSYVLHTTDGGQSWQKATLDTHGYVSSKIVFINSQEGWLQTKYETPIHAVVGPEHEKPPALYHSSDGGKTWTQVLAADSPQAANFKDVVIDGMNFLNSGTGWMTGYSSVSRNTHLFVTHDGGSSWQPWSLTSVFPGHGQPARIWPPHFFGPKDGVMPLVYDTPSGVLIAVTHDGGVTWKQASFLPLDSEPGPLQPENVSSYGAPPLFIDMQHGWVKGYDGKTLTLFSTSDGGQHWTKIVYSHEPDLIDFSIPDFLSATVAWESTYEQKNNDQFSVLYKTSDGGRTWTQVHARFPAFIFPKSA